MKGKCDYCGKEDSNLVVAQRLNRSANIESYCDFCLHSSPEDYIPKSLLENKDFGLYIAKREYEKNKRDRLRYIYKGK